MKSVILTGMPGAGKSTIGVLLAKSLCLSFVDTDLLIQKEHGALQTIINTQGISAFLAIEEDILLSQTFHNSVVATGGSAVLSERAMEHLRKQGTIIYLKLPLSGIKTRLADITARGIAMALDQSIDDVYAQRVPLYEKHADITVDCKGLSAEKTVQEILSIIA